jgi:hypothetical protein
VLGKKHRLAVFFWTGDLMAFSMRHTTEKSPENVEHNMELEDQDADDSDLSLETLITVLWHC